MTLLRKATLRDNFKEENLFNCLFLFFFPHEIYLIFVICQGLIKKIALMATYMQKQTLQEYLEQPNGF